MKLLKEHQRYNVHFLIQNVPNISIGNLYQCHFDRNSVVSIKKSLNEISHCCNLTFRLLFFKFPRLKADFSLVFFAENLLLCGLPHQKAESLHVLCDIA